MCIIVDIYYYIMTDIFVADDASSIYKKTHFDNVDLVNPKNAYDFQIVLSGIGKKVLEFGPSGFVTKILKSKGCHVINVEINPTPKQAKNFSDKTLFVDTETLDLNKVLESEKYDVILIDNFLECLKDPVRLLKNIRPFLSQNGYLVCSIRNIAHISTRIKLLNGEFRNQTAEFEDPVRFFTLKAILSMLADSGYSIDKLCRVKQDLELAHNRDLKHYTMPEELIESILRDPESTTLQYVFRAVPTDDNNLAVREWLMEFSDDMTIERLKEILDYYKKYLSEYAERMTSLHSLLMALKDSYHMRLQEKDLQIASLNLSKKMLEDIHQSFTWKMLRRYDKTIGRIISKARK